MSNYSNSCSGYTMTVFENSVYSRLYLSQTLFYMGNVYYELA